MVARGNAHYHPRKETSTMPAIHLAGRRYERARARAAAAGYASVDEYVADMLQEDVSEPQNFDHLFTPERIARLDQITQNIQQGGKLFTQDEVDAHFKARRDAWHGK